LKKVILIPVLIAILVLVAFATTNAYRVPTLEMTFVAQRPDNVEVATLTVEGVRCRGTSGTCAKQIEDVPGVVSMTTYARNHMVIIEYDPTLTDVEILKAEICEPVRARGQLYDVFSITE